MKRRDFVAALAASAMFARSWTIAQTATRRPRLLIAESDPFTGLNLLKSRYAAGLRPSEDISGLALSWQITKQKDFAERALAEMKGKHITPSGKPSRVWIDYAKWSLTFDWLLGYPGFDRALQDLGRAISIKKDFFEAFSNRGSLRLDMGDVDGALVDLNRSLELNDQIPESFYQRGYAYIALKNTSSPWLISIGRCG